MKRIILSFVLVFAMVVGWWPVTSAKAGISTTTYMKALDVSNVESEHDYAVNTRTSWSISYPKAKSISVTFDSKTEVESGFDFIYIFDESDTQIGKYTGTVLAGETVTVSGSSLRIMLSSDSINNKWGFALAGAEATMGTEYGSTDMYDNEIYDVYDDLSDTAKSAVASWGVLNDKVVTISEDGVLSGVATGRTTVIAYDKYGNHVYECEVDYTKNEDVPSTGILVENKTVNICVGDKLQLSYSLVPDYSTDAVTFTSNNPGVASVDRYGKVTGVSVGTTTIDLVTDSGSKAVVKVNVKSHATGIGLNMTVASVEKGSSLQLIANVEPAENCADTVEWYTSNEAVATVTQTGLVEAKTEGTATITAEVNGYTAACVVTVTYSAQSMKLSASNVALYVGGTKTLTATVASADDSVNVIWSSSNSAVAKVSSAGVITAVAPGTATITAQVGTLKASCKVSVKLKAPVISSVTASNTTAIVKWGKVTKATGYQVYRSTSKTGTYSKIASITSGATVSYKNTGLTIGKTYYYKIIAVNGSNKSAASAAKGAVAKLSAPAIGTTANATATSISINWKKQVYASGYYIYRKTSTTAYKKLAAIKSNSILTYTDKTAKGLYSYAIVAYKKVGSKIVLSAKSSPIVTRTLAAPSKIKCSPGGTTDKLTVKVTASKVSGANRYEVYKRAAGSNIWKRGGVSSTTTCRVEVIRGKSYYYKVRALYKKGGVTTYGPFKVYGSAYKI